MELRPLRRELADRAVKVDVGYLPRAPVGAHPIIEASTVTLLGVLLALLTLLRLAGIAGQGRARAGGRG